MLKYEAYKCGAKAGIGLLIITQVLEQEWDCMNQVATYAKLWC